MKERIRKKTGRILGGVFLFALVIGMLVVPYMADGEGKVAKAGRTFESYFNEAPVPKTELVYNGEDQELMNPGNGAGGNGIVRVLWSVHDKDGTKLSDNYYRKDAGEYTVKCKLEPSASPAADDNLKNEYKVTIAPARPEIETVPQKLDLTYNGTAQKLVSEGAVKKGGVPFPSSAPQGTMKYSLEEEGVYSEEVPAVTNAGIYTVWYKVEPNIPGYDDEKNFGDTTPASVTATIKKAPQGVVTAPAIKTGLKNNGTAQKLIIPGQTDPEKGTMKYSLSEDGEYSTNIPTGTSAGTYTVWYKVEGKDGNYEDVAPASIPVTISGSSSGSSASNSGGGGGGSSSSSSSSSTSTSTTPVPQVPDKEDERGVHTVIKSSDGSVTDVWTKTEKDGSITEIRKTTHPDGTVTETEIKISADRKHILKVQVIYDAQGRKIDTSIEFSQQKDSTLMNINLSSLKSLLEKDASGKILGGAKVIFNLTDDDGTEKFTVILDSSLLNEKELAIFAKERNGDLVMVQKTFTCTITEDGEMSLNIPEKGNYQLVSTEEARNLGKKILSSIKPLKEEASLKIGESINFKMSKDCNPNNILKITYKVKNNKEIKLKVSKKGKIILKKTSGDSKTITVTAKVKLKDGTTKKIKMEINVK